MITVVAIDALEYDLVEGFDLLHLKGSYHGKTDISEFSEPRTMVLWSSFMTGRNMESEVLAKGDKEMWNMKIDHKDTFFSRFKNPYIIDLPGYNYDLKQHNQERGLLNNYFESNDDDERNDIRKSYNEIAFEHHRRVKSEFLDSLYKEYDFLLGYFSIADVVGHLNFGNRAVMRMIYRDLDEITSKVEGKTIVLSDHGMKAMGYYGDHSEYGFWCTNFRNFETPRISDFAGIITQEAEISMR
jgi:hypothetical protein